MEDQWVGHMLETEDGVMSCLINIALAENCPDETRPHCTLVRIPFKDPGEDGLGSNEERNALGDFEDAIEERSAKLKVVHAASVRGEGSLNILYYSPAASEAGLRTILKDVIRGYEVEAGSFDDAEWEQFEDLYPPPEAIAEYFDLQVIAELESSGDQLATPRPVDHTLMLPNAEAANHAAKIAAPLGYTETDRQTEEDDELPITLQLTKSHSVDIETVSEVRAQLTDVAEALEGVYDGWGAPLVQ